MYYINNINFSDIEKEIINYKYLIFELFFEVRFNFNKTGNKLLKPCLLLLCLLLFVYYIIVHLVIYEINLSQKIAVFSILVLKYRAIYKINFIRHFFLLKIILILA